jgi:hypothetical protein
MSTVSSRTSQANLSQSPHKPVKEVQYHHVNASAVDKSRDVVHYNSLMQFRRNMILSYIIILIEIFITVTYFSPYVYIDPKIYTRILSSGFRFVACVTYKIKKTQEFTFNNWLNTVLYTRFHVWW